VPATHAWCLDGASSAQQLVATAEAGRLESVAIVPLLRWPASELLLPADDHCFVILALPYLQLAMVANCSGDDKLAASLYQEQPWEAVALLWLKS
jgi:hypothetical protein